MTLTALDYQPLSQKATSTATLPVPRRPCLDPTPAFREARRRTPGLASTMGFGWSRHDSLVGYYPYFGWSGSAVEYGSKNASIAVLGVQIEAGCR